tara:strand:+ start:1018 stop:1377 length:360 start_codon:yes stop_codon:yes gene_type:complete
MKFKILALFLVNFSSLGSNWTVSQTNLHHVQIGSANLMYISFDKHANVSKITCGGLPVKNWAALPLDSTNPKVQALISLALSAQAQKIKVDLGGPGTCQQGAYPTLDYIRIGQFTGAVK